MPGSSTAKVKKRARHPPVRSYASSLREAWENYAKTLISWQRRRGQNTAAEKYAKRFDAVGWEPFDDVHLANGITAAANGIDTAVDLSLEIVGLSDEGWEETICFEIVSDVTDYVHIHAKVCPSAGAVRERILQAQGQFAGLNPAGLRNFQQDANRRSKVRNLGLARYGFKASL